jgi:hypothetical protein
MYTVAVCTESVGKDERRMRRRLRKEKSRRWRWGIEKYSISCDQPSPLSKINLYRNPKPKTRRRVQTPANPGAGGASREHERK